MFTIFSGISDVIEVLMNTHWPLCIIRACELFFWGICIHYIYDKKPGEGSFAFICEEFRLPITRFGATAFIAIMVVFRIMTSFWWMLAFAIIITVQGIVSRATFRLFSVKV